MLTLNQKLSHLKVCLDSIEETYADSFKTDIAMYLGEIEEGNKSLAFLDTLTSEIEIKNWLNKLTSRIVLKFKDEEESINDFIFDYIANG